MSSSDSESDNEVLWRTDHSVIVQPKKLKAKDGIVKQIR